MIDFKYSHLEMTFIKLEPCQIIFAANPLSKVFEPLRQRNFEDQISKPLKYSFEDKSDSRNANATH